MYVGEIAYFLGEGKTARPSHSVPEKTDHHPDAANQNEFSVFPSHPVTAPQALKAPARLIARMRGHAISPQEKTIMQDAVIEAISGVDAIFSAPLVLNFWNASRPLGLGLKKMAPVQRMADALMSRLQHDLKSTRIQYSDDRIAAVQKSFGIIGADFTAAHRETVTDWLHEQVCTQLRDAPLTAAPLSGEDLVRACEQLDGLFDAEEFLNDKIDGVYDRFHTEFHDLTDDEKIPAPCDQLLNTAERALEETAQSGKRLDHSIERLCETFCAGAFGHPGIIELSDNSGTLLKKLDHAVERMSFRMSHPF